MEGKEISIVTNSLPIFEKLKDFPNYDLILVGGRYRAKTVGQFANKLLKEIKVSKAFKVESASMGIMFPQPMKKKEMVMPLF